MTIDTSLFLAGSSVGLLAGLVLLVLAKRVVRGIAEGRSRQRRARWVAALGTGPLDDMRMRQLAAFARHAARRTGGQEDLLSLLNAGRLGLPGKRREWFLRALRRGGLEGRLRSQLAARSAVARGRAVLLWAGLGLDGAERLIAPLMADPDPDVRAAATQALAACESEEAAWALLRGLRAGDVEPPRVVERLTGAWAAGPVLAALSEPSFEAVRPWLAEALGLTRDPRAEGPLVDLLENGGEEQRIRACRALGRLGRQTSSAALTTALWDSSPGVRAQAARALGELREERSVHSLLHLMGDRAWWVRARAAEALQALGPPGLVALRKCARLHPDPFARERAAEALMLEADAAPEADKARLAIAA